MDNQAALTAPLNTQLKKQQQHIHDASSQWNTSNLALRVAADAVAAGSASLFVAPVITLIDRAIIEKVAGHTTLLSSLGKSFKGVLLRPHQFIFSKPFGLIYLLYFGTYFTANTIDTASSVTHNTSSSSRSNGALKFVGTTAANMGLGIFKDSRFAQMFGSANSAAAAAPRPVPPASIALFAVRDCITIFASFNLPPKLAPLIPISDEAEKIMSRASTAQFFTPAAFQLLSTPLHLLGLDMFNRPSNGVPGGPKPPTLAQRLSKVRHDWIPSSFARMCRIIPAYGVGGVVNTGLRTDLMHRLE